MEKYIDADKLKVELDRLKIGYNIDGKHNAEYDTCVKILRVIDSLQQEQPGVDVNLREPNVDLSKEIEDFCLEYDARKEAWYNMVPKDQKLIYNPTWQNFATNLAYHFYNRGYNAVKEK